VAASVLPNFGCEVEDWAYKLDSGTTPMLGRCAGRQLECPIPLTKTVSYFAGNGFEINVLVAKMTCFSVPFARCSLAARYSSLVTISMNVSRLG